MLDRELGRLASEGPTDRELDKAINQIELSFLYGMETPGGKAEQLGFYETIVDDGRHGFARLDAVRKVTPDSVTRAVRKYLRSTRRTRIEVSGGLG